MLVFSLFFAFLFQFLLPFLPFLFGFLLPFLSPPPFFSPLFCLDFWLLWVSTLDYPNLLGTIRLGCYCCCTIARTAVGISGKSISTRLAKPLAISKYDYFSQNELSNRLASWIVKIAAGPSRVSRLPTMASVVGSPSAESRGQSKLSRARVSIPTLWLVFPLPTLAY
jgi:hypothetical protein